MFETHAGKAQGKEKKENLESRPSGCAEAHAGTAKKKM
jgi:hypothetical protein